MMRFRTLSLISSGLFTAVILLLIFASSSPGSAKTYNWRAYSDHDPLLYYSPGDWETAQVRQAVGGELTYTVTPGASLTATFMGTGIEIIYSKGAEGGNFQAYIDGTLVQERRSQYPQYTYGHEMTIDKLPADIHTLTLVNVDGATWIESVRVQGMLVAPELESLNTSASTMNLTGGKVRQVTAFPEAWYSNLGGCWKCELGIDVPMLYDVDAVIYYLRVEPYMGNTNPYVRIAGGYYYGVPYTLMSHWFLHGFDFYDHQDGFYCIGEREVCEEAFVLRPELFSYLGPLVLQPQVWTPPLDVYPEGGAASFGAFVGYGAGPVIDGYAAVSFHTYIISTIEDGIEVTPPPTNTPVNTMSPEEGCYWSGEEYICPISTPSPTQDCSPDMAVAAFAAPNQDAPQLQVTEICYAATVTPTPASSITPTVTGTPDPLDLCEVSFDSTTINHYLYTSIGYVANLGSQTEAPVLIDASNLPADDPSTPDDGYRIRVVKWITDPLLSLTEQWAIVELTAPDKTVIATFETIFLDTDASGVTLPNRLDCDTGQTLPEDYYLKCAYFTGLVNHTNGAYTAVASRMQYQDLTPEENRVLTCIEDGLLPGYPDYEGNYNARFIGNRAAIILHTAAYYSRDTTAGTLPTDGENPCVTLIGSVLGALGFMEYLPAFNCQGTSWFIDNVLKPAVANPATSKFIGISYSLLAEEVPAMYNEGHEPNDPAEYARIIRDNRNSISVLSLFFHKDKTPTGSGPFPHVSIVIGWGAPTDEDDWETGTFTLYTNPANAGAACGCEPVPYVMDRGYGGAASWMRGPRAYNSHEPNYARVTNQDNTVDANVTNFYVIWVAN